MDLILFCHCARLGRHWLPGEREEYCPKHGMITRDIAQKALDEARAFERIRARGFVETERIVNAALSRESGAEVAG